MKACHCTLTELGEAQQQLCTTHSWHVHVSLADAHESLMMSNDVQREPG